MSMGEIESSAIYGNAMVMEANGPATNFFTVAVYMGFIFMILMVLMNLLNGLAVSDVKMIADMAEVNSALTRLQMIAETDSLVSLFKKIRLRLPICIPVITVLIAKFYHILHQVILWTGNQIAAVRKGASEGHWRKLLEGDYSED